MLTFKLINFVYKRFRNFVVFFFLKKKKKLKKNIIILFDFLIYIYFLLKGYLDNIFFFWVKF